MITDSFDNRSPAIISPEIHADSPAVDGCILTFSHAIEQFVLKSYPCEKNAEIWLSTGMTPVYRIGYQGKSFAFYKTYVGAPPVWAAWRIPCPS